MTQPNEQDTGSAATLEAILDMVESIDENVQEILDHLTDYIDSSRFGAEWYAERYSHDDVE